MSLLIATADGRIAPGDAAAKYIPAWSNDPRKSRITVRHLATHTSGIEDAEQDSIPHEQLPGWKGAFWKREPDPFSPALHDAPLIFEPGSRYAYSNPGMAALSYAVTRSLQGGDIRSLLKERVFDPLGVPQAAWSIGYNRAYAVDGLPLYANWGGGAFTARATARVGQLMMLQGLWNGRQLIRREAVQQALTYAGMPKPPRSAADPAPGIRTCLVRQLRRRVARCAEGRVRGRRRGTSDSGRHPEPRPDRGAQRRCPRRSAQRSRLLGARSTSTFCVR